MATAVIIHAAEDALPARALAEKLRQAKLTVVLEKQGEDLRNALKSAQVSIALWSPRSVSQAPLADDVSYARGKGKVVHATMQNAVAPDAFRGDQTVNLTGWRGEDDFAAWRELAQIVTSKAGVAPLPAPAPRPASGFFTPGVVDPQAEAAATRAGQQGGQPRLRAQTAPAPAPAPQRAAPVSRPQPAPVGAAGAPRAAPPQPAPAPRPAPQRMAPPPIDREPESGGGGGRGMMVAAIAFVVVALIGGGGYFFWNQTQSAETTSAAWDAVAQNDADAIRAFLSGDPGEYRDEAQTALAELEERSFEAASDSDTIEAFEAFLNDFPESEHSIAARGRIAELQTLQPASEEGLVPPPLEGVTPDPDLLPPDTAAPAPETTGGPAPIAPPPAEPTTPSELPSDLPTN